MNHVSKDYKQLADYVYSDIPKSPATIVLAFSDPENEILPSEQEKVTFDVLCILLKQGLVKFFPQKTIWDLSRRDYQILQDYFASVDWIIMFEDMSGNNPLTSSEVAFFLKFKNYTTGVVINESTMYLKTG